MIGNLFTGSAVEETAETSWRRPGSRRDADAIAMESWLETFSADTYLPMLRLAESLDPGFLARHCPPEEVARYKREQRRMLGEYLRALSRDFGRLLTLATERYDQTPVPMDDKMQFIFSVWSAELRLLMYQIAPRIVDLRPLLLAAEDLRMKARGIALRRLEYRVI